MKRTPPDSPKWDDARLRALLKGLREEVAPPPGFSARVLESLRAQGMLAKEPARAAGPDAESLWSRLGAALFAAPRWGLAAGAALAFAVAFAIHTRPSAPLAPASARPVAPASVAASVPSRPSAPVLAARRPRQGGAVLARARVRPRLEHGTLSTETVLASSSSSSSSASVPGPLRGAVGSAGALASAPALGQGSAAPRPGLVQAGTGLLASGAAAGPGTAPAGGSVSAPLSSGGGPRAADASAPVDKPTPTPSGVTPVPSLPQNSQVRNNVILASRGQSAQILFKVAQEGQVLVAIYSRLGGRIAVLQNGPLGPGQYDLSWAGQSGSGGLAASGIYEVVIQTPTYTDLHKMMLVK